MKLKLTLQFIITFLALTFVMHEAHEIVHTTIGRIICGCWGERDFNVWGLCEGCSEKHPIAIFSTFAGPIFTFSMIWLGTSLIGNSKSNNQKEFGFSLIFANMPFARILTASMGGGDEVWGLNQLLNNHSLSWTIGLITIITLTIYPLWKAYQLIENNNKIFWFLGFFLLPTLIDLLLVLGVMNTILEKGVLNKYWILGSPILVTIWTSFVLGLYLLPRKNIYKLTEKLTAA
jgi:hypothetical protein